MITCSYMLDLSHNAKLASIPWNIPFWFAILVNSTIPVPTVRFVIILLDYLNTLEFIKTIGSVTDAKNVYRNHIEKKEEKNTNEVLLLQM